MAYDGTLIFDTGISTDGFAKGVKSLSSIAGAAMKAITAVVAGGATAIAGLGTAAIKTGMDFESQMSRVQAISGATQKELEALNEQAIQLGADTAFSASEAAQGMENLASAGFGAPEIMDAMPGMMDLAAASGEDLANSADIAASTLRGFGLEASEAGHVADVLAENAARTNAAVADTGEAMKYAAPVAHAMGLSFEECAAAIGIMSDAGIKGGQAGTTLRGTLSRLAKPTKVMQDTMDELGLSFFDSQGNMLSLSEIVSELENKMGGLTQEQRNNALVTLFGQESLSGMLALMDRSSDDLEALTESYRNCDGAAKEMAETMQDNLKGQIEEIKGSFESLGIKIYQDLQDPLKDVAKTFGEFADNLLTAFDEGGFSGLATSIIGQLADGLSSAGPVIFSAGLELIGNLAQSVRENAGSLIPAAMDMLVSLSGSLRENAGLLIDAGLNLITALAQSLINNIPVFISTIPTIITNLAGIINDNAPKLLMCGVTLIAQLALGLIQAIPTLISNIPKIIQAVVSVLVAFNWVNIGSNIIRFIADGIKSLASSVPTAVRNIGQTAVDWLRLINWRTLGADIIDLIRIGVQSLASSIPTAVKTIGLTAVKWFKGIDWIGLGINLVKGIIVGISGALDGLWAVAGELCSGLLGSIKSFFGINSPSTVMTEQGGYLVDGLINGLMALPEQTQAILSTVQSMIINWGLSIANQALMAASQVLTNLMLYFSQIPGNVTVQLTVTLNRIISFALNMISTMRNAAETVLIAMVTYFSQIPVRVAALLLSTLERIIEFAENMITTMSNAAESAVDGMISFLSQLPGKAYAQLCRVTDMVFEWGANLVSSFRNIGVNVMQGLIDGIESMVAKLYDSIKKALSGLVDKAKAALGINSPSKIFADEVGQYIPPGIGKGYEAAFPALEKKMADSLNSIAGKMKSTVEMEVGKISLVSTTIANHKASTEGAAANRGQRKGDFIQTNHYHVPVVNPSETSKANREAARKLLGGVK